MKSTIFLAILLMIGLYLPAQDPQKAEELIESGIKIHDNGDYIGAIKLYEQALSADKDNKYALAELSMSCFYAERHEDAIKYAEVVIEKYPGDPVLETVYVSYGNALDALKRSNASIEAYDKGIKAFPKGHMLYFNKGVTLTNWKREDEAIVAFQQAIMAEPRHPGSHNALGRIVGSKGMRIPALMALLRFMVVEPASARSVDNLRLVNLLFDEGVTNNGKKNISISFDASSLGDTLPNGKPKADNFGMTEMLLTVSSALVQDKKNKKLSEHTKFQTRIETLCSALSAGVADGSGFYWDYYAPYFVEMAEAKQVETFSYIAMASTDDAEVAKWLKANKTKIEAFYTWSSEFDWPKSN